MGQSGTEIDLAFPHQRQRVPPFTSLSQASESLPSPSQTTSPIPYQHVAHPSEILTLICHHLRQDFSLGSLARFSQCSKRFYNPSVKVLYQDIHIFHPGSYDQLLSGLDDDTATDIDIERKLRALSSCTRLSVHHWPDGSSLDHLKALAVEMHHRPIFPNVTRLEIHVNKSAAADEAIPISKADREAQFDVVFYFGLLMAPDHICVHRTATRPHFPLDPRVDALARGWSHQIKSVNYHAHTGPVPNAMINADEHRFFANCLPLEPHEWEIAAEVNMRILELARGSSGLPPHLVSETLYGGKRDPPSGAWRITISPSTVEMPYYLDHYFHCKRQNRPAYRSHGYLIELEGDFGRTQLRKRKRGSRDPGGVHY